MHFAYPEIHVQTNVISRKAVHLQIYGNEDNHHHDITVIDWLINLICKLNGGFRGNKAKSTVFQLINLNRKVSHFE